MFYPDHVCFHSFREPGSWPFLLFHEASGFGKSARHPTSRHPQSACPSHSLALLYLQESLEESGIGGWWTGLGARERAVPKTRGLAAGPEKPPSRPPHGYMARDLPVVPERRAWPVNCPYTEAAWGKALKGGTEAPAGTPEPTCCRSKKAELDKEEGVELELDTSGVSCFMAKGE